MARVEVWRGDDPGMSRHWAEGAVKELPPQQRPQARLALLAALASYQVDDQVLDDARPCPGPDGDRALITTAAWASFTATRRIGTWLHPSASGAYPGVPS
jgi:hypothetical protein